MAELIDEATEDVEVEEAEEEFDRQAQGENAEAEMVLSPRCERCLPRMNGSKSRPSCVRRWCCSWAAAAVCWRS